MNITKLEEILSKSKEAFGDLSVVIHDGEHFHELGRISVLEVVELEVMSLVLRIGDPKEMDPLLAQVGGKTLREGENDDWMQKHISPGEK